jgi:hypothetical protein
VGLQRRRLRPASTTLEVKSRSCFGLSLLNRPCTANIHDTRIQGHHLRWLIQGPILDQLLRKIEELPDLQAAAAAGTATLAGYAMALIACADSEDTLAVHRAASQPARNAGEKLSDAVARAGLAIRSASAHGCQPGEAGRHWAVFGLLMAAERSTFSSRFGVGGRMRVCGGLASSSRVRGGRCRPPRGRPGTSSKPHGGAQAASVSSISSAPTSTPAHAPCTRST